MNAPQLHFPVPNVEMMSNSIVSKLINNILHLFIYLNIYSKNIIGKFFLLLLFLPSSSSLLVLNAINSCLVVVISFNINLKNLLQPVVFLLTVLIHLVVLLHLVYIIVIYVERISIPPLKCIFI